MQRKLADFFHVDLARLNVAGWLLMLASLGVVIGGIALFAMNAEREGGPPPMTRWVAYLCWVGAALLFFGGQWALEALGVGIYRRPPAGKEE